MKAYLVVLLLMFQLSETSRLLAVPSEKNEPKHVFHVAPGIDKNGSLIKFYKRGLDYAVNYFGNYGPYHIYLLGPKGENNIKKIFRERALSRVDPKSKISIDDQIKEYLNRPNVKKEIQLTIKGKAEGGLTWTPAPNRIYEDVTTNAIERSKNPIENTWGALHEYHHVFQVAHTEAEKERNSDTNFCSWMAEGMATYSSAKFMENLGLIDFKKYMLELRKFGGNIGRPGINEFIKKHPGYELENETYWDDGKSAQVYYMIGAWATAYLIHSKKIKEKTVLKDWWFDIIPMGKAKAFEKHMKISLNDFYDEFDRFIKKSDDEVMKIFEQD